MYSANTLAEGKASMLRNVVFMIDPKMMFTRHGLAGVEEYISACISCRSYTMEGNEKNLVTLIRRPDNKSSVMYNYLSFGLFCNAYKHPKTRLI